MKYKAPYLLLCACISLTAIITGCETHFHRTPKVYVPHPTTVTLPIKPLPHSSEVPINTGKPVVVTGIRKFPYPYLSMLAISSDADHETLRKFNLIHEFINTKQMTPFGYYGLGLDFSDSVFMYNGTNLKQDVDWHHEPVSKDQLSYFKGTSDKTYAGPIIDRYIHAGWIDTLHTYGDFNRVNENTTIFKRQLAQQAISALDAHGDAITVWTDHGNKSNVDNFGSYGFSPFYTYQMGANPWSEYYHTDFTIPYGVRFVWADRSCSKFGSASTIYPIRLPDDRLVWGFLRYTNSGYGPKGQVIWNWSVNNLNQQLSPKNMRSIEEKQDYVILAQHLEAGNGRLPLPRNAVFALIRLAHAYNDGHILVARTSRLLNYNVLQQNVQYTVKHQNGYAYVYILGVMDPVDGYIPPRIDMLRGLTFYTTNPAKTVLLIGNKKVPTSLIQYNPSDGYSTSIGIKWFPPDTTNYAVSNPSVF